MDAVSKTLSPIISHVVNPLLGVLFTVGVVFFIIGVVEMVMKGNDPEARKKGQWHMVGGVVGMFIMVSAWGIVRLVADTIRGI